ncbi:hypothetical protein K7X08_032166 [Anisodus acutangulus]|uniref:RNase H type-1 domain-containing protein n=1 Tax=Anisodus acutangulus TaxID=402998 RepID=A0A9Q1MRG8_9SOLA|nr:hypothetical protein K7X08_032166 [Anisodus acutangulus]
MKISIASKCRCCDPLQQKETVQHLFLTGEFAQSLWQYYRGATSIIDPFVQIHQAMVMWWDNPYLSKLKHVFQAVPTIVCWPMWKRRNAIMNGECMSKNKVIYCINLNLHNLIRTLYHWLRNVLHTWPQMVQYLEEYKLRMGCREVMWETSSASWFKCNTDGASRGNPGQSSPAFCIRDDKGDLINIAARRVADTTNICAEAMAIGYVIAYYVEKILLTVVIETDSLAMLNII